MAGIPFINVAYIRSTGPLFTVPPFFGAMVRRIIQGKGSNGVPVELLRGEGIAVRKGDKRVSPWVIALSSSRVGWTPQVISSIYRGKLGGGDEDHVSTSVGGNRAGGILLRHKLRRIQSHARSKRMHLMEQPGERNGIDPLGERKILVTCMNHRQPAELQIGKRNTH